MKRTSKRYVVSTDALNSYGYRVLTVGIDYSQYLNNPILLWMHQRAYGNDKNQILPLGRAVDIQVSEGVMTCALEFDETDDFAMQVYNKYENGTLNMLSLGAKPLEWSDEPDMLVSGQTGPTFTKSKMTDISCVDMGGNDEACACQLYDANDKKIELFGIDKAGFIKLFQPLQQIKKEDKNNMNLIQLTGPALTGILLALKLENTATEADVQKAVADMIQLNMSQSGQIATLKTDKQVISDELAALKLKQGEVEVITLVDKHNKKYLPGQREKYIRLAKADLEGTKELLEGMPELQSVKEKLELGAVETTELDGLIKLSWDELHQGGKLERLKELDNDAFLAKRAVKFPVAITKK